MTMRLAATAAAIGLWLIAAPAPAYAMTFTRDAGVDVSSEYVFRGMQRGDWTAFLNGEVKLNSFYLGALAALPLGSDVDEIPTEARFWLGWTPELPVGGAAVDVGATVYVFPDGSAVLDTRDTVEVYAGVIIDLPADPTLYAYYDFERQTASIEGSIGHFTDLPNLYGVDVSLDAGWVSPDAGLDYGYLTGAIDLVRTFPMGVEAFAGLRASIASEDTMFSTVTALGPVFGEDATAWIAAGVSATF